jgi:ABC-type polar amino acid transport system ATPase subunit
MITIDNVSKSYASTPVLKACSTTVAKGEVVVVCGPSGSGKSTLIKCVNGLEPFQHGSITVDGISVGDPKTDLPRLRARVGMVFQHFELFPHMSVRRTWRWPRIKVLGREARTRPTRAACGCSTGSASPPTPTSTRPSFPAASSSAWPSPAPWPWTRCACCSTNRPRRSTRR